MTPAKTEQTVKLTGLKKDGTPARVGSEVRRFQNDKGSIVVKKMSNGNVCLLTHKGKYELIKHDQLNSYHGQLAGIKARLTCKKLIAQLSFWAA